MMALWQITLSRTTLATLKIAAVNHNESVTFDGVEYEPWPITYDVLREMSDNSQPSLSLTVGSIDPQVVAQIDAANAMRGMPVEMYLVHKSHLGAVGNGKPFYFTVRTTAFTPTAVTVTCAGANLWDIGIPHRRIQRTLCNYAFKSEQCGYRGPETHCAQTYAACTAYGDAEVLRNQPRLHPQRWGARPGMPTSSRTG